MPNRSLEEAIKDFYKEVKGRLIGLNVLDQELIDSILLESDSTPRLERFGAAIILSVSIATLKAAASSLKKKLFEMLNPKANYLLPSPLGNVLGGGKHAKGRSIDIQEILIFCREANNIYEAIELNIDFYKKLFKLLSLNDPNFAGGKNDEGALVTRIGIRKALSLVKQVVKEIKEEKGKEMAIGLDIAASSLWDGKKYTYQLENLSLSEREQLDFISSLIEDFGVFYLEDPFHEDSFDYFAELNQRYDDVLIVGDDLYASNEERLKTGIEMKATDALIIKPNQVGSVTRILRTLKLALEKGIDIIVSHRSGETEDVFISHLAVAYDAPLIKSGTVGGERISKLNELIRISEYLGEKASMNNKFKFKVK